MFWLLGHKACGILAPQPGIKPTPRALEGKVATTGSPEKSQVLNVLFHQTITVTLLCILKGLLNKYGDFFHCMLLALSSNSLPQVANWGWQSSPSFRSPEASLILSPLLNTEQFFQGSLGWGKPIIWIMLRTSLMEVQLLTDKYLLSLSLQCRSYK